MPSPRSNLADIGRPYFEAAERGQLLLPRCNSCGRHFFYGTVLCQHCRSDDWDWVPSAGNGSIYSYTVVHRPLGSSLKAPYVVVVVTLEEGVRVMANLLDADPEAVAIDQRVQVDFAPDWQGKVVPMFRLAGGSAKAE
ncbi:MAG TPA: Zn-ribbon domain-containing OB-fold protein [Solirubrobacteraceae bacterium]|jgi:hypothetical protein